MVTADEYREFHSDGRDASGAETDTSGADGPASVGSVSLPVDQRTLLTAGVALALAIGVYLYLKRRDDGDDSDRTDSQTTDDQESVEPDTGTDADDNPTETADAEQTPAQEEFTEQLANTEGPVRRDDLATFE